MAEHSGSSLGELVQAYRAHPGEATAGQLLDRLQVRMASFARAWRPQPPAIGADDIRQQLALEILEAARSLPPHLEEQWLERQLFLRAGQALARWLVAERAAMCEPLGHEFLAPAGDEPEARVLQGLIVPAQGDQADDIEALIRNRLQGVPVAQLAEEQGVTQVAMKKRLSRAGRRLLRSNLRRI